MSIGGFVEQNNYLSMLVDYIQFCIKCDTIHSGDIHGL